MSGLAELQNSPKKCFINKNNFTVVLLTFIPSVSCTSNKLWGFAWKTSFINDKNMLSTSLANYHI